MAKSKKPLAPPNLHPCGTMDLHRRMAAESPEYRRRARALEYETRRFVERYGPEGLRLGVVRIPVVVHILWNTPEQNFTDAQVQAQIDSLNADFRATNADAVNVPAQFASVAADTRIEFALAVRDASCNFTNGIERRQISQTGFTINDEGVIKSTSAGGLSAWDTTQYLNVWVVHTTDGYTAYAYLPAYVDPLKDGIVVSWFVFGQDPAHAPYELGRVLTHEAGHWLNLLHIWGDDTGPSFPGGYCAGSDGCNDTPNQAGPNYGLMTGIVASCGNDLDGGNMYMNYMDYTDDACKCLFTADQSMRMTAALAGPRRSILGSTGLIPPDAPTTPDYWVQRATDDNGAEPYAGTASICDSNDIWVRNGTDGHYCADHQNPISGQSNEVYVRVRNRACPGTPTQLVWLKLYWAKASPSLSWPPPWDGSISSPLMGGPLGSTLLIMAGGTQIAQFPWTPPDPSDYAAFGAEQAHFCLLARIETVSTPPFGMTVPETGNLADNVINNNNIAWKNVSVVDADGPFLFSDVVIGQFARERRVARYAFETPRGPGTTIFDWGFLLIEARGEALAAWLRPGLRGNGFQRLDDGRLLIMKPGAWIEAPPMEPGRFGTLHIQFVPNGGRPVGARILGIELTERDREGRFLGGQHMLLRTQPLPGPCWDNAPDTFDGVDWAPPSGRRCGPC